MTSKHWALVGGAVACLISVASVAAPWVDPGDARARYAIQKLADRGHLNRPTTTWPIMWSTIDSGLSPSATADGESVGLARAYLRFEQGEQAKSGIRGNLSLHGQSSVPAVRGFDSNPLAEGSVSGAVQWQGDSLALGLSAAYAHDPDDGESFRLDGSYAAGTLDNWVVGAGALERWWGPGWQSSLILSNNARPMPSVWLNRRDASAPQSPWLSWIGPWQLTVLAGQYEADRAISHAKLLGTRLSLRPLNGLELGFSRMIMLGGEGRPEGVSTLWNAFIGRDNGQQEENDPGNQLGSIDVRYGFAVGEQSMGLYAQMMGEDEAGAFPARKSWLFGADWTSQLWHAEQQWFVEYVNTLSDDLIGQPRPNITYDHSRYRTGYRYYGRSMGASVDGDSEAVTVGAYSFLDSGANLSAKLTYARLNIGGTSRVVIANDDVFYTVPADQQSVAIAELGYGTPALNGWLTLSLQGSDTAVRYLSGEKDAWRVAADWTYRF